MVVKNKGNNFDSIADRYDSSLPPHVVEHYLKKRIKFIKKYVRGKSILDVGCGTAMFAQCMETEGFEVTGLDSSQEMLDIAKKRFGGRLVKSFSDSLPFDNQTFDAVVSIAVFYHIADKEKISKTISEMVRVLRKSGVIIIWDHNPLNPYWPVIMKKVPQDTGEERLIPAAEIKSGLIKNGISQIKIFRKGFVPEFIPEWILPVFQILENMLEKIPIIDRFLLAHNIILAFK